MSYERIKKSPEMQKEAEKMEHILSVQKTEELNLAIKKIYQGCKAVIEEMDSYGKSIESIEKMYEINQVSTKERADREINIT